MMCPDCEISLARKSVEGVDIDECSNCKGMWFENDELRRAKDKADSDLNWLDFKIWKDRDAVRPRPRGLPCPQCSRNLVTLEYGDTGVEIDYCPGCRGTWLDRGEFGSIIEALTKELLSKPFSDYVRSSLEEAKEIVSGPESFLSEWKDFATVIRMLQYRLLAENPRLAENLAAIQNANPVR